MPMEEMPLPRQKQEVNVSEEVTQEQVIKILIEKDGLTDPSAKELFIKWMEQEEEKAQTPSEQIDLLIRQADIYEVAGMTEQARNALEGAKAYVFQMRDDVLCEQLESRIAK
jgi:hypothetical protein